LPRRAADLLDGFIRIAVDDSGESRIRRLDMLERSRLAQFGLALFEPRRGGLFAVKRPGLPMMDWTD
jgi:hypothetical protein